MKTQIFDGQALADQREQALASEIAQLPKKLKIAAILFQEDEGSQLYTRLKREAAQRVGIEYQVEEFSLRAGVEPVLAKLTELNRDSSLTGIIIQKPWRKTWIEANRIDDANPKATRQAFTAWWRTLTTAIQPAKDVDGLHPTESPVLPATVKAVLTILEVGLNITPTNWPADKSVAIIGKSDIFGLPMTQHLQDHGVKVDNLGSREFAQLTDSGRSLPHQVVISATGQPHLITGQHIMEGAIVIDVGEPRPDVDRSSAEGVEGKVAFLTPVPGGVGPLTVISLLENCLALSRHVV